MHWNVPFVSRFRYQKSCIQASLVCHACQCQNLHTNVPFMLLLLTLEVKNLDSRWRVLDAGTDSVRGNKLGREMESERQKDRDLATHVREGMCLRWPLD